MKSVHSRFIPVHVAPHDSCHFFFSSKLKLHYSFFFYRFLSPLPCQTFLLFWRYLFIPLTIVLLPGFSASLLFIRFFFSFFCLPVLSLCLFFSLSPSATLTHLLLFCIKLFFSCSLNFLIIDLSVCLSVRSIFLRSRSLIVTQLLFGNSHCFLRIYILYTRDYRHFFL